MTRELFTVWWGQSFPNHFWRHMLWGVPKVRRNCFFLSFFFPHLMSLLFSVVRTPAYVHIFGLVIIIVFGHQNWPHLALYVALSFPLCSQIRVHCIYIRHILMLHDGKCSLAARPF